MTSKIKTVLFISAVVAVVGATLIIVPSLLDKSKDEGGTVTGILE